MMTSWPGPTSSARSASSSAALPELTAAAAATPRRCASPRSNAATSGPCARWPPRTTRATRSASSSPIVGREWGIMVAGSVVAGSMRSAWTEGGLRQVRVAPTRPILPCAPQALVAPTHPTSEIQEQPDRLERLRVLDSRLNAPKVRARPRQLQDCQILDVGLRHLRPMRLEARQLRVQHLSEVRVTVRVEVPRRRHLVEKAVRHVACRRHCALSQLAMVLVRVVGGVDEDHPRLDLPDHRFEPDDDLPRERHLGVPVIAPEDLAHAQDACRVLLLPPPHLRVAA